MRPCLVGAVVLMAVWPSSAGAQSLSLTEADAIARLGPENPRVRAARAGVAIARADVAAAARWPNPRVTWDRESVAGVTENLTMVGQVLPITGVRRLNVDAATARVDATARFADEQVRQLRTGLRLAFANLLAAQERERELAGAHDRVRDLAAILARREAAGDAAGFDRLRAEREVLDLAAARDTAAAERGQAQAILAGFMSDGSAPSVIVAVRGPAARDPVPALEDFVAKAETVRGDLQALQREMDASILEERAAGRLRIPEPEVIGGTKTSSLGAGHVGSVVMVHVTVPLFDRARPERAMARALTAQAQLEIESRRVVIRADVAALRAAVLLRREAADRHRTALGDATDALARIAQVSYDAGERGILELLDALRGAADARVRQVALDLSVRQAELELERVSGWEVR